MKSKPVVLTSNAGRAISLLIVSINATSIGPFRVAADEAIPLSQVLNAWRKREQRVKSFRFQWSEDHFQAKGSLELPPAPQYKDVVFPPKDTTYRVKSSCEMGENAMRYSFSGESLQLYNDGALEHREYVSASDGDVSKAFWPIPNKLRNYPKGVIFDEKICSDASTLDVKPLLWMYRALDPRFAFSENQLQLLPRTGVIDGRACAIVGFVNGQTKYSIWTDPARDFVPLRFTISSSVTGETMTQADITYRQDPSHGWTPTGWQIVQRANGDMRRSIIARVTDSAINIAIPRSRFQIDFPPGTVVIDMRNNSERYVVGADGSKQIPRDPRD
jgi:hypothetical protein